jgi:hypothetical protein
MNMQSALRGERLPTAAWLQKVIATLPAFIDRLRHPTMPARYVPALDGVVPSGAALQLGYTALAVKLHVILGTWQAMSPGERQSHVAMIQAFQTDAPSADGFWGAGAFVDPALAATLVKTTSLTPSRTDQVTAIRNVIRAESKQAIASLMQVGASPKMRYTDLPNTVEGVRLFLESFDWQKPWSAGGQTAALAMLLASGHGTASHSEEDVLLETIRHFFSSLLDPATGAYFSGPRPAHGDLVNGAMKVLTALDWLNEPVHAPERLIDTCLAIHPSHEGCHMVDAAYVLHRCQLFTTHRAADVQDYARALLEMIRLHHNHDGGFSYWIGRSQTSYYGVPITTGMPVSDIHGTLLLTWALAMVVRLTGDGDPSTLAVIRP